MTIKEKFRKSLWFQLILVSIVGMLVYNPFTNAEDAEEWMPDAALRAVVREALKLPADVSLTKEKMQVMLSLAAKDKGISDIIGLEYATNLKELYIEQNPIIDLSPLAGLTQLQELQFWHSLPKKPTNLDLTPLANLINLKYLGLSRNGITDISPLAGLKNLIELNLYANYIDDFSPLVELRNLKELWIHQNSATDFSMLAHLNLETFVYDEFCIIEPRARSVEDRLSSRNMPSVFQAWDHILGGEDNPEVLALHDLFWTPFFGFHWEEPTYHVLSTMLEIYDDSDLSDSIIIFEKYLERNPNMVSLMGLNFRWAAADQLPSDSDFWLRDSQGNRTSHSLFDAYVVDLLNPIYQEKMVEKVIGIAKCGFYDGIMIDSLGAEYGQPDYIEAYTRILQGIREHVRDDFLIIGNVNRKKVPAYSEYINGVFMETGHDSNGGYTREGIMRIEDTLLWAETQTQEPRINCLEGEGLGTEPPDGPNNLRLMRLFTTMSLTFSDGYVLYTDGSRFVDLKAPHHGHIWHDFWDAELGRPVGGDETKGQTYNGIEGLFIREFTNGWAIYNRSGKAQEISLPIQTTGVASGITSFKHTIPDLDGEMFLKTEITADVNGDGIVNIQDLVIVANALGKAEPDLNGDGVVNIQDLVIVANAFE